MMTACSIQLAMFNHLMSMKSETELIIIGCLLTACFIQLAMFNHLMSMKSETELSAFNLAQWHSSVINSTILFK